MQRRARRRVDNFNWTRQEPFPSVKDFLSSRISYPMANPNPGAMA
jgi:hypothetical protein